MRRKALGLAVGAALLAVAFTPPAQAQIRAGLVNLATMVTGVLPGANGGTGVANTSKTITLGGNLTTSGANNVTFTTAGATDVTLPTTGTLGILGANTFTANQTIQGTFGSELAPALTAGNWTVGTGWQSPIVGPGLIKNADGTGTQTPSAATTIVVGTTYRIVITLSAWSVGSATYTLGGTAGNNTLGAAQTYTDTLVAKTTGKLIITPTNTSRFTISAISILSVTTATGDVVANGNLQSMAMAYGPATDPLTNPMHGFSYVTGTGTLARDPYSFYVPCTNASCSGGGLIYLGYLAGSSPGGAGLIIGNRGAGITTELTPQSLYVRGNGDLALGSNSVGLFTLIAGVSGIKLSPLTGTDVSINNGAHLVSAGTAPALTSGFGTGETIAGTDLGGKITVGSGGDTVGVITFNRAWTAAPACWVQDETTSNLMRPTTTTTTLTITGTMVASDVLAYGCGK